MNSRKRESDILIDILNKPVFEITSQKPFRPYYLYCAVILSEAGVFYPVRVGHLKNENLSKINRLNIHVLE